MATWSDQESPAWEWVEPRQWVWPDDGPPWHGLMIVLAGLNVAVWAAAARMLYGGPLLLAVAVGGLLVAVGRGFYDGAVTL